MITFREGLNLDLTSINFNKKIRERKSIDQRNPLLGYFLYSNEKTDNDFSARDLLLARNPYLGYMKHSPSSENFNEKSGSETFSESEKSGLQLLFGNNYKVPFLSQGLLLKEKRYADRISSNDLLKIPQSIFSSTTSSDEEDYHPSCSICLEVYSDGDVLRTLNCCHVFHKECIDIWLIGLHTSKACPCCRSDPLQQQDQCSDISTQSFIRMGLNVSTVSLQSDLSIEVDIDVDLEKVDVEIEEADDLSDSFISETTSGNDLEAIVSLSSCDSDDSEDSRSWFIISNSP